MKGRDELFLAILMFRVSGRCMFSSVTSYKTSRILLV